MSTGHNSLLLQQLQQEYRNSELKAEQAQKTARKRNPSETFSKQSNRFNSMASYKGQQQLPQLNRRRGLKIGAKRRTTQAALTGLSGLGTGLSGLEDASSAASNHGHNSFHTQVHVGHHGGHSGYGHGGYVYKYEEEKECENDLNPILAGGVLAGLAAASYIIFNYLTVNGRRKKRALSAANFVEEDESQWAFADLVWAGR